MNKCNMCSREYVYDKRKGCSKITCNSCYVNKRRFGLKKRCVDLMGGKCSICGYDKCIEALDFHHTDPEQKDFEISGAHSRSWEIIEKEIKKCILLCSNCHREIHTKNKYKPIVKIE